MPSFTSRERLREAHGDFSRANAGGPRRVGAEGLCQGLGGEGLSAGSRRSGARGSPPEGRSAEAAGVGLAAARAAPRSARAKGNNEEGRREGRGPGTEPREPPAEASSPTRLCYQSRRLAAAVPPLPPFWVRGLPARVRGKRGLERSVARAVRPPSLDGILTHAKKLLLPGILQTGMNPRYEALPLH